MGSLRLRKCCRHGTAQGLRIKGDIPESLPDRPSESAWVEGPETSVYRRTVSWRKGRQRKHVLMTAMVMLQQATFIERLV